VADTWSIKILKLFRDPAKIDPEADWFNDWLKDNPAAKGQQFFTVRIRITNEGDQAGEPLSDLSLTLVSDTGFEYDFRSNCGTVPGQINRPQIDAGDSIDSNLCWIVQNKHVASLHLVVRSSRAASGEDEVVFALKRPVDSTETAAADPPKRVFRYAGTSDGDEPIHEVVQFTAGEYDVDASCTNTAMQVYVFEDGGDPNNLELVTWPVSRSRLNEPSIVAVIPRDDAFLLEIWCDGTWSVQFEAR
jgi:hypothetical protein